jgi:hypothetical protein
MNNDVWQELQLPNKDGASHSMYLLGAYMDKRVAHAPVIRLLAAADIELGNLINGFELHIRMSFLLKQCFITESNVSLHCHLWFGDVPSAKVVKAVDLKALGWRQLLDDGDSVRGVVTVPHLFVCPLPKAKSDSPVAVSVVSGEDKCLAADNALVVRNSPWHVRTVGEVAVCLKALEMALSDASFHMVEWLEAHRALGATKVFVYVMEVHENVQRVLDFYEKEGFVDITRLPLPGNQVRSTFWYDLL